MADLSFSVRVPLDGLQANIDLDPYLREQGLVLTERHLIEQAIPQAVAQLLVAAINAATLVTDEESRVVFLDEFDAELAERAESQDFDEAATVLNGVRQALRDARASGSE